MLKFTSKSLIVVLGSEYVPGTNDLENATKPVALKELVFIFDNTEISFTSFQLVNQLLLTLV
jgi:hypothetical protein